MTIDSAQWPMHPIGVVHSAFTQTGQTPIQASRSDATGSVEVFPQYVEGLQDLDEFSHIILIYVFDRSEGYKLQAKPFLDHELRGIFATRYPFRPNPIGLSVVRLLGIHGNQLKVADLDVFDGTPLLDIKPYVAEFDVRTDVHCGWYERRPLK
jgi:tRNA-Thr(GGU) m(6)t(6)A37 methyltransferase TsaA